MYHGYDTREQFAVFVFVFVVVVEDVFISRFVFVLIYKFGPSPRTVPELTLCGCLEVKIHEFPSRMVRLSSHFLQLTSDLRLPLITS